MHHAAPLRIRPRAAGTTRLLIKASPPNINAALAGLADMVRTLYEC